MNNKKIDEIGEKLNVNSSEIKPKKFPNWFKKHSFWMIQVINFFLSILMSLFFGLTLLNVPYNNRTGYPYSDSYSEQNALRTTWGVLSINILNGIITIPTKRFSNLNRIVRIVITILNFIVSLAISHYIFRYIDMLRPPKFIHISILYNVYKSPVGIKIQKKIIDTKN